MKGTLKWFSLMAATVMIISCSRQQTEPGTSTDKANDEARVQPGRLAGESDQTGYLELKITTIHEKQKPLDQTPWHADGGEWTFLDCELAKNPSIHILIGTRTKHSDQNKIPVEFGEALLAINEPAATPQFIEAFAKAFHLQPPPSHGHQPPGFVRLTTAVLGNNMLRDTAGGFKGAGRGTWAATKWFFQDGTAEAEVFFNYSISQKCAEFLEKDEEYRGELIQQMVNGLRDGPLPERTPENDARLTSSGPKVMGWTRIADAKEACEFSPGGDFISFVTPDGGTHSKLFVAPIAHPEERKLLAEFDGMAFVQEFLMLEQGLTLLVVEKNQKDIRTFSSNDPQKLWLVTAQGKHKISMPADATNGIGMKNCLSPDGRYIALHSWQRQPDQKQNRVIYLGDLRDGQWRKIEMPDLLLELVGWTGKTPLGIVLASKGLRKSDVRKPYSLEPGTGKMSSLESIPVQFDPGQQLSPDQKHSATLVDKERLIITEIETGQKREFLFVPNDKRNIIPEIIHWADDRHLVFEGSRTAFINIETLKMSFATAKESDIQAIEFSPGLKFAIGLKDDGHYLGRIEIATK